MNAQTPVRIVMIEDAAHWVHHDQLDAFVKAAGEFLGE